MYYIHQVLHHPSKAYKKYSMLPVLYTPTAAYPKYCMHRALHHPNVDWLPYPASLSSLIAYLSIELVVPNSVHWNDYKLTNELSRCSCFTTLAIHCLQNEDYQVLGSRSITDSNCISKLERSLPVWSQNHGLQVHLEMYSIATCMWISMFTWSCHPSVSAEFTWTLAECQFPDSPDHGFPVQLKTHVIIEWWNHGAIESREAIISTPQYLSRLWQEHHEQEQFWLEDVLGY